MVLINLCLGGDMGRPRRCCTLAIRNTGIVSAWFRCCRSVSLVSRQRIPGYDWGGQSQVLRNEAGEFVTASATSAITGNVNCDPIATQPTKHGARGTQVFDRAEAACRVQSG